MSLRLGDERRGEPGVRFWGIIDWGPHHQDASGAARMSCAAPWDRVTRAYAEPSATRGPVNHLQTELIQCLHNC